MKRPFSVDPSNTAALQAISDLPPTMDPEERLKVVVLGGGTGAPVSIRTLLSIGAETSAVVSMADDGGSTGILREQAHVSPPGDIRKCLVAFAKDHYDPLTQAFRARLEFAQNHTLGNLMLSALEDATGSFPEAIAICEDLLEAQGHVYPSTLDPVTLAAETRGGAVLYGQANACYSSEPLARVWLRSESELHAYAPALQAIRSADLIVLGPGSLFTSIIPNLLVPGIVDAIAASRGKVLFVCAIADVQGETKGLTALDHVRALNDHGMAGLLDYALIHAPHLVLEGARLADGAVHVSMEDINAIQAQGTSVIACDLVDPEQPTWHEPRALRDAFAGVLRKCRSTRK